MSQNIYLITLGLPLLTILIVFGMRYASKAAEARARLANEGAYKAIAEQSAAAQAQTAGALSSIQAALTETQARLTAVEAILKAVE